MGPLLFNLFNRYAILLTIVALVSCNGNQDLNIKLALTDTLYASFPTFLNRDSYCAKTFKDEYIYWLNKNDNSITRISFENDTFKVFQFEGSGPESVGNVNGISVIDPQNIYLSVSAPNSIYLIDDNGKLKKEIIFSIDHNNQDMNNYSLLNSKALNDIYQLDGENAILVPRRNPSFKDPPPNSLLRQITLFTKIYMDSGDGENLDIHPPDSYFSDKGYPYTNTLRSCFTKNKLFYSFSSDPIVYYHDFGKDLFGTINVSPNTSYEFVPLGIKHFDTWKCINFEYGNLYITNDSKYIYRLVKYPKLDDVGNCKTEEVYPYKFSVLVTTIDGKLVLEEIFTGSIYSFIHAFLYKDSFYLLRSPYHPEYDEEMLAFDKFEMAI